METAEYRIRPNGDKIAILPAADYDDLVMVYERAQDVARRFGNGQVSLLIAQRESLDRLKDALEHMAG